MNPNAPFHPQTVLNEETGTVEHKYGINIRDYIAIEAMKAITLLSLAVKSLEGATGDTVRASIAATAYMLADALIAESNKKSQ